MKIDGKHLILYTVHHPETFDISFRHSRFAENEFRRIRAWITINFMYYSISVGYKKYY
jgi:hypothetical protein